MTLEKCLPGQQYGFAKGRRAAPIPTVRTWLGQLSFRRNSKCEQGGFPNPA